MRLLPALLCLMLCAMLCAQDAAAGAWPREKGATFVSLGHTATTGFQSLLLPDRELRGYTSLYAEHGLTEAWTLGLDAGIASGDETATAAALVFLRHPLGGAGIHRFAAEAGIGYQHDDVDGTQGRLRPGLSWGRGFDSRWGGGWLGLETSADLRLPTGDVALKADATAGIRRGDDWMLIFQVQSGLYPGSDLLVRLAPSVVRQVRKGTHLQLGLIGGVAGDDSIGGKLGLWMEF
jgi:hypothetical protein